MRIVIIGGTGLIGTKVVARLCAQGHDAVPASPNNGVDILTGKGLAQALAGADTVVDVSNSPSFDDDAVLKFFQTATRNLLAAEAAEGVKHHVVLSVVGTERLGDSSYMRAKMAQETMVKESTIPHSIVHATQFFELAKGIADSATDHGTVRVPSAFIQPMAAEDVAEAVADVAAGPPLNRTIEVAGPEAMPMDEFIRRVLRARGDDRAVIADGNARYFGTRLGQRALLPDDGAKLGKTRLVEWLAPQAAAPSA
jgi:uncharacterized protein YbjT (DUF2867 family)